MKVYLKLNFENQQKYCFNGYVNNVETDNMDASIKELNENKSVLLNSGYETIGGFQKLRDGITHPFNEFYFKIGFKKSNGTFWNISSGVDDIEVCNNFKLKLDIDKIYFIGDIILKCNIKEECFDDLLLNLDKVFIDECSIKKICSEKYNDYKTYRFTYTGTWEKDNEIKKKIIENKNNSERKINIEYSKSLRKTWIIK